MSETVAPGSSRDCATEVLVDGEAPESDEEEAEEALPVQRDGVQPETGNRALDILHRKLHQKNQLLRRQLKAISLKPYTSAAHDVSTLNQQMLVSGLMIEDAGIKLKKMSADMKCLSVCMDHLSEVGTTAAMSAGMRSTAPSASCSSPSLTSHFGQY